MSLPVGMLVPSSESHAYVINQSIRHAKRAVEELKKAKAAILAGEWPAENIDGLIEDVNHFITCTEHQR